MKSIRKIILVLLLSLLFVAPIKAVNFTCKIGRYNVEYDTSGNIVGAKTSDGTPVKSIYFGSYFKPKKSSECPKEEEVEIKIIDGGRTFNVYSKVNNEISKDLGSCNKYTFEDSCTSNKHHSCVWTWTTESAGYCSDSKEEEKEKDLGGCNKYNYETSCRTNTHYSCIWNETKYGNYCNTDKLLYVKCGDAKDIPHQVPQIISFAVNFLKILTPLILIFISIISLLKAISAGNEDEMKKAQKGLIRKIIAAVMVFFIISIVQFVIMKVADNEIRSDENGEVETTNLSDCLNCFLNNNCGDSVYYKTYVGSELIETFLNEN